MTILPWIELEPRGRATTLKMAYQVAPEDFMTSYPDQILVEEFGIDAYLNLLQNTADLVPIVAIPTVCLNA